MSKIFIFLKLNKKNFYSFVYSKTCNSLLEELILHKVPIEFQCCSGYCGICRVKLINGKVRYRFKPIALLNNNEIVPCCSFPISNITIDLQT